MQCKVVPPRRRTMPEPVAYDVKVWTTSLLLSAEVHTLAGSAWQRGAESCLLGDVCCNDCSGAREVPSPPGSGAHLTQAQLCDGVGAIAEPERLCAAPWTSYT